MCDVAVIGLINSNKPDIDNLRSNFGISSLILIKTFTKND